MTSIPHEHTDARVHSGIAYEVYRVLQVLFVVAPIVAGVDKFLNTLTWWPHYLAPWVPAALHVDAQQFMYLVGVVEIVAGIGVAIKPKYFGFVVSAWLVGIIINLLSCSNYYDIALRDLGLAGAAYCLGRLGMLFDHGNMGGLFARRRTAPAPTPRQM